MNRRQIRRQVRRSWSRCNGPRCNGPRRAGPRQRTTGATETSAPRSSWLSRYPPVPHLVPAERERCPCGSREAYRRCCKKLVTPRRRLLRRFIEERCVRAVPGAQGIAAGAFIKRFGDWLRRRRQSLPVEAWLATDLLALGHAVDQQLWARPVPVHLPGLSWRAVPSSSVAPANTRGRRGRAAVQREAAAIEEKPAAARPVPEPEPVDPSRVRSSGNLTDRDFLAQIAAAPDDDELRQVYADWLQERGDPRGELIALQLAGRARTERIAEIERREQRLIARHGRGWLGPLAAVVRDASYRRGMLDACSIQGTRAQLVAVIGLERWLTVRELSLRWTHDSAEPLAELIRHPVMRSLRSLRGVWWELGAALRRGRPRTGLEGLEELFFAERVDRWRPPRRGEVPALRHLGLPRGIQPAHLDEAELWGWLPRLSVYTSNVQLLGTFAEWQRYLSGRWSRLSRFCFFARDRWYAPRGLHITLTRGRDGRLSAMRVQWVGRTKGALVAGLVEGLEALDPAGLTELVIDPCRRHGIYRLHRQRLERALARQTRLQRCELPHGLRLVT